MSEFRNVTVVREANVYFEGKVSSRTVLLDGGERKTLGLMLPGEYTFGTDEKELMEILSGEVEILLPGENEKRLVQTGGSFEVPAKSSFQIKVVSITDYCCSYLGNL